jgi:hypothetical protein
MGHVPVLRPSYDPNTARITGLLLKEDEQVHETPAHRPKTRAEGLRHQPLTWSLWSPLPTRVSIRGWVV